MTTTLLPTRPATPRVLAAVTIIATLPYLMLKAIWLTGGSAGVRDPGALAEPAIRALNGVTVVMDLLVIALASLLTRDIGRRLPAWLVLLPVWVGTGLLVPMAVAILPATLIGTLSDDAGPLEPWVQPMVYGGFAVQGVGLAVAFALYATRRWGAVITAAGSVSAGLAPLLRVLVGGGATAAVLSGALHLASGIVAGTGDGMLIEAAKAGFAVAGAAGVLRLARGTADGRWGATVAAWIGTGAMVAWGLWAAALTMSGAGQATADPLTGGAELTGLLGGIALAVAGLMSMSGTDQPSGDG